MWFATGFVIKGNVGSCQIDYNDDDERIVARYEGGRDSSARMGTRNSDRGDSKTACFIPTLSARLHQHGRH